MENFAGNCSAICDNPNISTDLKAVCDSGSQAFCTRDAVQNIINPSCRPYLSRVVGNNTAARTGLVYSNPVAFPSGSTTQITNYYAEVQGAINKYATQSDATLISADTDALVKILRENNPTYANEPEFQRQLLSKTLEYCDKPSADANFCKDGGNTWFMEVFKASLPQIMSELSNQPPTSTLSAYTSDQFVRTRSWHKKYPITFKPIEDLLLSRLTKTDLTNPMLPELRSYSNNLQTGIDTFIINLINGPKNSFTQERLEGTPLYSVNINNNPMLYDKDVMTYLNNLNTYRTTNNITTTDPLLVLVANTNATNAQTCASSNPLTTPICVQMNSTGGANTESIKQATQTYCSNNVNDPNCISFINANPTIFNTSDVNNKMLNYCLTNGMNDTNCKPFSAISGSADWLKKSTSNITAADGSIIAVCGTTNGLAKDTCQKVCDTYPDLCAADIQQKCSLPTNRYSTNTDTFIGKNEESQYPPLFWILVFCIVIVFAWKIRTYRSSPQKVGEEVSTFFGNYPDDADDL